MLLTAAVPMFVGLAACSSERAADPAVADTAAAPAPSAGAPASASPAPAPAGNAPAPAGKWEIVSSGEGDGLFFGATEGEPAVVHMFCPREGGLLVNVNAFRPVGSEERMTFGSGGTAVTLVADPAGDADRGGVSGEGPVPGALRAILTAASGVSINYGAQNAGPLPQVPATIANDFVAGCTD